MVGSIRNLEFCEFNGLKHLLPRQQKNHNKYGSLICGDKK